MASSPTPVILRECECCGLNHVIAPDVTALLATNAALVKALLAVVAATRAYLPPDGIDAQECLNRIIGATDNPEINPVILEAENAS